MTAGRASIASETSGDPHVVPDLTPTRPQDRRLLHRFASPVPHEVPRNPNVASWMN